MKHLVDKTILVPFQEELKYAVCIVSGWRFPAFRQGKQSVWLAVGSQTLFAGRSPHPLWTARGPKDREKRKSPLFGRVSRCVGRMGRGGIPVAHKNPLTALVEAVWRKAGTAARTRFHPKTESEPTGWKYSRRKNRRFCSAGSLTTARSAGSCGILKGRCSGPETETMALFSVEFGCLLRTAKNCWGAPGLWGRECPSQELRY